MKSNKNILSDTKGEIVLYQIKNQKIALNVTLDQDTVWLTQKQIAALFHIERSVITKHINNIFKTNELKKDSVCANYAHTASDCKTYETMYYNLDMILNRNRPLFI